MSEWFRITAWREPAWFGLFVVLAAWLLWNWRRARGQALPLGPAFLLESLPKPSHHGPRFARLLHATGLGLLIVAMARPVEDVPLPPEREGVEVILAVDRSSSMEERDLDPQRTRLEVAVDAAARFVDGRERDRIGVLAFARYPDLLSPTSLDHEAVREVLREIVMVERDGPEDLTGIGAAVARAAQVLRPREAASKVVVLLTDGRENVATPAEPGSLQPLEAAALCRAWGVQVYPIAMAQDDPEALTELARATGGQAFAAQDAAALDAVFQALDRLARSPLAELRFEQEERFLPWLGLGLLLLLVGGALRFGPAEVWS